jgi:hypothetical protein
MRPPSAANSLEEALRVDNDDLVNLSPSGLHAEMSRAARNAAHNPLAMVWRGTTFISNRQYADERIAACLELLRGPKRPPPPARCHNRTKPWT